MEVELENKNLPTEVNNLEEETRELTKEMINSKDTETFKQYIDKFNLNIAKKDALRIQKLTDLQDKIADQVESRIVNRPEEIPNKELTDYWKAVSEQRNQAKSSITTLADKPAIVPNPQSNNITVNVYENLNDESRKKVLDIVDQLLNKSKENQN